MNILSSNLLFQVIDCPFLSLFYECSRKSTVTCIAFCLSKQRVCALSFFSCKRFMPLTGNTHQGVSIQILIFGVNSISCIYFNLGFPRFSVVLKAGNKCVLAWSGSMQEPHRVSRRGQRSQLGLQLCFMLGKTGSC